MNKLIYENKALLNAYEIDKVSFIAFLYMTYTLKRLHPETKKFNTIQNRMRMQSLVKSSIAFRMANRFTFRKTILEEISKDPFDYLISKSLNELKEAIIDYIHDYFIDAKEYDDDIDRLVSNLFGSDLKDVLIISPFIIKYMLGEVKNFDSIGFNFYNDKINFLCIILFELENIKSKFMYGSLIENLPEQTLYDSIIFMPPYVYPQVYDKIQSKPLEGLNGQSGEAIMAKKLSNHVKENGRAAFFLQSGILNKLSDLQFKKHIVDNNIIDLVVELPKLKNIPNYISLISISHSSHEGIKAINATKFAQNRRRGVNLDSEKIIRAIDGKLEENVGIMAIDYIIKNNYDLTPHRFLEDINAEFTNPTKLGELTTQIFRGYQISSEMLDEYVTLEKTKIKLLTLSDIEDNTIDSDKLQSLKSLDKKMEHYILEDKDLIISCKGKTFKTAVVNIPYGYTYVSTGSIIVIRCDHEKLDPVYLKIFLDSYIGIDSLKRIQTGTKVLSLNPTQLQNIMVPVPSLSRQLTISSSYKYKLQNIKEVQDIVNNMKDELDNKFDKNFLKLLKL